MVLEALVLTACLNQKGCEQSKDAYYKQSTDLQAISSNLEKMGKHVIEGEEWMLYVLSPGYYYATGKMAKIKLNKYFYINVSRTQEGAGIEWHW